MLFLAGASLFVLPCRGFLAFPAQHTRRFSSTAATRVSTTETMNCTHFASCSGCLVEEGFDSTPIALRARARLEPILGERLDIAVGDARRWRTQARLAVAGVGEKSWNVGALLGLYRGGSHDVVRIPECQVHAAAVNAAAQRVEEACREAGVRGGEDLRYVQFSVDRGTGLVAVSLVWNKDSPKAASPVLSRLMTKLWSGKQRTHERWHSIWVNYRGDTVGNAIFSNDPRRWERLRGHQYVREKFFQHGYDGVDVDLQLSFTPLVFRQANMDAFADLVGALSRWVPKGSEVCELYAGVGAIGLALRPSLGGLRCSEVNPHAEPCFLAAARDQDRRLPDLPEATFLPLDAAEALEIDGPGADVLIVDPPRKGLENEVISQLTTPDNGDLQSIKRIVYVSCGFDAFERDLAQLAANDKWHIVHAQAFVLFPGSDHIETLAIFDRGAAPRRTGSDGGGGGKDQIQKKRKRRKAPRRS